MIDAPPSIGRNLLYAVGNITHLPITHQVYSHSHADHNGASFLYGNITRIGHRLTHEYLALANDPYRPLPDKTFSDKMTLTVGNQTLHLENRGPNHSPDNSYIYAPAQKVLVLIDIIFPKWSPYLFLGKTEDTPGYMLAHKYALEYDFEHLVAGHLTLSGTRQDVEDSYGYVSDLYKNCREAYLLGISTANGTNNLTASALQAEALAANPNNPYAALSIVMNAFSNYCNEVTNKKWAKKLAGTDMYGWSHAYTIIDALRIEQDVKGPYAVAAN
ncbi:Lactamase_B domain-containing protein [Trichoderma simmonsii]|uniref:Lactamase_B domain-containing protein n=1 Tax=Trichoderma simmonsii TaxID=1491479 RepID=A0A8G0LQ69_9HYPO|nr:Lactamase_B domain-containing protein [Trichoderma simmonsii]